MHLFRAVFDGSLRSVTRYCAPKRCNSGDGSLTCLLCCWRACLEHSSYRRHLSTFPTHFPKTLKTAPLPILLSRLCPLNSLFTLFVVLVVAVCYLGHVKNFLIDWLIDWYGWCNHLTNSSSLPSRITNRFDFQHWGFLLHVVYYS